MSSEDQSARSTTVRRAGRMVWATAGAAVLVWAAVAGWPQLRAAGGLLGSADRGLLAVALCAQLSALVLLSMCYRAALRAAGAAVTLPQAGGVALRAGAVSRLLPGGGGAAVILAVRRLRRAGVPDGPAAAGVAVNAVVTMGALVSLVAAVGGGSVRGAVVWAVLTLLGVTAAGVALRLPRLRRRLTRLSARMRSRPPLRVWAAALHTVVVGPVHSRDLAAAVGSAAAAWSCELAALWFAVAAVGHPLPLAAIALGLGAANAAAAAPHTPGGVGVVEVAMTAAFVAAGVDTGAALAGVLAYRAVGFWLPVAVGGALLAVDAVSARPARRNDDAAEGRMSSLALRSS